MDEKTRVRDVCCDVCVHYPVCSFKEIYQSITNHLDDEFRSIAKEKI